MTEHEVLRRSDDAPTRMPSRELGGPRSDALLDLQRQAGNQAVARLVQRAPKDGPATTDAPGGHPAPKKKPAPKKAAADIKARVLRYDVDQGIGRITISAGSERGVKVGMSGLLLGKEANPDFVIEKVTGATSEAHVKATLDEVSAGPDVLIKASTFADESQEGKEF